MNGLRTEAELLRLLANTPQSDFHTLGALVAELDQVRARNASDAQAARDLEWGDTVVAATLGPAQAFSRSTAATDWMADIVDEQPGMDSIAQKMVAEGALWFGKTASEVKADPEEFAEQARGYARRVAGQYGELAPQAAQSFLDYVAFLHRRQGASGLDQLDQTIDPNNSPKRTPYPGETFDNFAPPVHPMNEGVDEMQSSENAPTLQNVIQSGDGEGQPEVPDMHSTDDAAAYDEAYGYAGAQAALDDGPPSPALGYRYNMDDFVQAENHRQAFLRAQAANRPTEARPAADQGAGARHEAAGNVGPVHYPNGPTGPHDFVQKNYAPLNDRHCALCGVHEDDHPTARNWNANPHPSSVAKRHEGASGLDQIDQTIDPNNAPKPTGYPGEVAFPINPGWANGVPPEEENGEQAEEAIRQRQSQAAKERCPNCGSKIRDNGDGSHSCTNCDWKTETDAEVRRSQRKSSMTFEAYLEKTADQWGNSDTMPNSEIGGLPVANSADTLPQTGTSEAAGRAQGAADAQAGKRPTYADAAAANAPFQRGYAQGYSEVAQGLDAASRDLPNSLTPGIPNNDANAQATPNLSMASLNNDPDYRKAKAYASKWTPDQPLVRVGSANFERGLYDGIASNSKQQQAWVAAHELWAEQGHSQFAERIAVHRQVTAMRAQAGTSVDLDTIAPGTSADPGGSTPINGPGTPPPGSTDGQPPAAPGGASPYNGAPPYGSPVAPDPAFNGSNPGAFIQGLPQRTMAFRQAVQAALVTQAGEQPRERAVPCNVCGKPTWNYNALCDKHGGEKANGDAKQGSLAVEADEKAPYRLKQSGDKWQVVNKDGEVKGTHDSKGQAREQQKAMYANVPGAAQSAKEDEEKKGER